jgi:hypothetical protein
MAGAWHRSGSMLGERKKIMIEDYGYCSKTGKCINPFGIKPEWVQKQAAKIRQRILISQTQEAPF